MCQNTLIDSLLNFYCLYNFNTKDEFYKEKKCREEMEKEESDGLWVLYITFILVSSIPHTIQRLYEQVVLDLIPFVLLSHFNFFIFYKYHFLISFFLFYFYVFNCENREVGQSICNRLSKAFFGEQTHQKHLLTTYLILIFFRVAIVAFLKKRAPQQILQQLQTLFPHSLFHFLLEDKIR